MHADRKDRPEQWPWRQQEHAYEHFRPCRTYVAPGRKGQLPLIAAHSEKEVIYRGAKASPLPPLCLHLPLTPLGVCIGLTWSGCGVCALGYRVQ